MISSLQKQLIDEKDARARLESELVNLKHISQEISNKLDSKDKKRYHWYDYEIEWKQDLLLWESTIEWI